MKNNLWIILISVVITLSSCITAAQFNNAEDDVYYSPKANNIKQPVMIPEVDIDEIIRQNPPNYGEPTNRLDDESYTNPMAAIYSPTYRSYPEDTTYQNPRVSAYVDPSLATESENIEADNLRRMYSDPSTSGNWNAGIGLSWLGPTFSVGYSNYPYGYYGYDPYYSYGYPYYGYGYGYGYNPYYNPYYGYGWCSPWYGYGYGGYCPPPVYGKPDHGNSNTGISRRRPVIGSYTPPANTGRSTPATNTSQTQTNGQYTAPALPGRSNQPVQQNNTQQNGRAYTPTYTPTTPQQTLENVNGRRIYRRPAETTQPATQSSPNTPAYNNSGSSNNRRSSGNTTTNRRSSGSTYNAPTQTYSVPNSGRSGSSGQSSGRSSGSSSGSQSSGGRRR